MISYYKDFEVIVFDDQTYAINSTDNSTNYKQSYCENIGDLNKHGIKINKDGIEISSAIICENGGGSTIHEKSYILKDNSIFICCGSKIYSLNIPLLTLNWRKELDSATCFGIYEFEGDLLIHGELEISRLTKEGLVKWKFSGRDIFVSMTGNKEFEIVGDKIKLFDFDNFEYLLDANGNEIK